MSCGSLKEASGQQLFNSVNVVGEGEDITFYSERVSRRALRMTVSASGGAPTAVSVLHGPTGVLSPMYANAFAHSWGPNTGDGGHSKSTGVKTTVCRCHGASSDITN